MSNAFPENVFDRIIIHFIMINLDSYILNGPSDGLQEVTKLFTVSRSVSLNAQNVIASIMGSPTEETSEATR